MRLRCHLGYKGVHQKKIKTKRNYGQKKVENHRSYIYWQHGYLLLKHITIHFMIRKLIYREIYALLEISKVKVNDFYLNDFNLLDLRKSELVIIFSG